MRCAPPLRPRPSTRTPLLHLRTFEQRPLSSTPHPRASRPHAQLFLAGDDDAIAHLDAAVADSFRARDAGAAQEAERLERENAALDQRIAACRSGPDTVAELEARNEAAREDAARLRGIAGELQSHLQALQQRITEKRAETEQAEARDPPKPSALRPLTRTPAALCRRRGHGGCVRVRLPSESRGLNGLRPASAPSPQTDIAASRAENELLRARISAQEISTADVERLVAQRVKLEEARAALAAQRAAAERAACECELALEQRVEEIGAGARAYEQAAEQLKIVPFGAKRSNNVRRLSPLPPFPARTHRALHQVAPRASRSPKAAQPPRPPRCRCGLSSP